MILAKVLFCLLVDHFLQREIARAQSQRCTDDRENRDKPSLHTLKSPQINLTNDTTLPVSPQNKASPLREGLWVV